MDSHQGKPLKVRGQVQKSAKGYFSTTWQYLEIVNNKEEYLEHISTYELLKTPGFPLFPSMQPTEETKAQYPTVSSAKQIH